MTNKEYECNNLSIDQLAKIFIIRGLITVEVEDDKGNKESHIKTIWKCKNKEFNSYYEAYTYLENYLLSERIE